jgi:hypothetical protein
MINLLNITSAWWGNLEGKRPLGDLDVDDGIILRWTFRKWDVAVWTGLSWLRLGTGGRTCECGD